MSLISPVTPTKKSLKEEIMELVSEKLVEKVEDMVNQTVQDALKKFQDTTDKEFEKTQKQLHELMTSTNTKVKQRTL
jgi:DNA-binding protein YbaB